MQIKFEKITNLRIKNNIKHTKRGTLFINRDDLVKKFQPPNNCPESFVDVNCIFLIKNTYYYGYCKIHLMNVSKHFTMHPTEECYRIIRHIDASNWYYEFENSDDDDDDVEIYEIYDNIKIYPYLQKDANEYIHVNQSYFDKNTFVTFKNYFNQLVQNDKQHYINKLEEIIMNNLSNKHIFNNYKVSNDYKQKLKSTIEKLQNINNQINNNQATLYFTLDNYGKYTDYVVEDNLNVRIFVNKDNLNNQFKPLNIVTNVEIDCIFIVHNIYFYGRVRIPIQLVFPNLNNKLKETATIIETYDDIKIYSHLHKDANEYIQLNQSYSNEEQFKKFKKHFDKLLYEDKEDYIKKLEDIISHNLGNKHNLKNRIVDDKYKKELLTIMKKLQK